MSQNTAALRETVQDLLQDLPHDLLGSLVLSTGVRCFSAANNIAPGGASGLGVILNHLTGLPIGTLVFAVNVPILILAYMVLGRLFTLKSFKTIFINTLVMDLIVARFPVYQGSRLLGGLFGGVLVGAGIAIVFMRGSTTGGSDIISRVLQKKFPYMSIGTVLFMIDGCIMVLAALAYQDIETALYGIICIFMSSRVTDTILNGTEKAKLALISSPKNEEIAQRIIDQLGRGATFLNATGAFSHDRRDVLMCAVKQNQFYEMKKLVYQVDPRAFIIIAEANEIIGQGFRATIEPK